MVHGVHPSLNPILNWYRIKESNSISISPPFLIFLYFVCSSFNFFLSFRSSQKVFRIIPKSKLIFPTFQEPISFIPRMKKFQSFLNEGRERKKSRLLRTAGVYSLQNSHFLGVEYKGKSKSINIYGGLEGKRRENGR